MMRGGLLIVVLQLCLLPPSSAQSLRGVVPGPGAAEQSADGSGNGSADSSGSVSVDVATAAETDAGEASVDVIIDEPPRRTGRQDEILAANANSTRISRIDQYHRDERADNHKFFQTRIIGGRDADADGVDDSFIVSLQDREGKHFCGATLITKDCVLTAAHCTNKVTGKGPITAVIGREDLSKSGQGERLRVRYEALHPNYEVSNSNMKWEWDFAVMCMTRPTMTRAKVIRLNKNPNLPRAGQTVEVAGWGDINAREDIKVMPDKLQKARLRMVSNKQCDQMTGTYGAYSVSLQGHVKDNMMCAKNRKRDSCQGDSGGPLFVDGVQMGITSWGVGCMSKLPGVYARVSSAASWINRMCCRLSMMPPASMDCEKW